MKKCLITDEKSAIEYIKHILNEWGEWKTHHSALVQALEMLINKPSAELTAENKLLNVELGNANFEILRLIERGKELTEENERLQKHNAMLIEDNHILSSECIPMAKADTVKKYREGLYRGFASLGAKDKFNKKYFLTKADQVAKEMLEEK